MGERTSVIRKGKVKMKDFQLRNDTKLMFRNDPVQELCKIVKNKKVLFVYGSGSVKKNGCYDDVKNAIEQSGATLIEAGNSSRERTDIERNIQTAKDNKIELIIGAGGASIMDCAKLTAFGYYHTGDLWDYVKGKKNPYGLEKLALVLMPTYPSSGSENGLGAVAADSENDDFGTAYGIPADYAILTPKYSMTLNEEMTAYTALVTLVQLSASTIGDKNPVSYDCGIAVIRNVLKAAQKLKENPEDQDARGVILYGAAIFTSGRLGIGKEENYSYDIYELEFIPEVLFGVAYRKSLTTIFPRFLEVISQYHKEDICKFIKDAFGYEGNIAETSSKIVELFETLGVDMQFKGNVDEEKIRSIDIETSLKENEVISVIKKCTR